MNNSSSLPPEDRFSAELRESSEQVRRERGECPSSAQLLGYASGTLTPVDAESVRSHIARCGVCDVLVTRVRVSNISPAAWKVATPIVVICLALAAWLMLRRPPAEQLARNGAVLQAPSYINLDLTRSAVAPAETLRAAAPLVLSFFIPMRPGNVYTAVLKRDAQEVARYSPLESYDGNGNCLLVLDSVAKGAYTLSVHSGSEQPAQFPFRLQ